MILQLENFEQTESKNLDSIKNVIDSLLITADTVSDITADGKVNFFDFPKLAQLGGAVVGFKQLPDVVKTASTLNSSENKELRSYVSERLDYYSLDKQHDTFENIVSKIIDISISLISLIQNLKHKA